MDALVALDSNVFRSPLERCDCLANADSSLHRCNCPERMKVRARGPSGAGAAPWNGRSRLMAEVVNLPAIAPTLSHDEIPVDFEDAKTAGNEEPGRFDLCVLPLAG